jgi:uncharacterized phage protein (TIGR02220 family)
VQGWIKLHREVRSNWLYQEKRTFSKFEAWVDLLLEVNHKDNKVLLGNEVIDLKRGQTITSIRQLCDRWGWSNTKVKQFFSLLQQDGMVTIKSDTKKTLITVEKYDFYQCFDDTKTTQNTHENDTEQTQKHTNKNDKNDNNDKNEKKEDIPYVEIVSYLNEKANTSFRPSSKKTQQLIKARCNEGFKLPDFQRVIDKKVSEWLKDSKMNQYLRPETLFGTKFESYLNQKGGAPNGETFNTASPAEEYNLPF